MLNGKCSGYLTVLEYNRSFSKQNVKIARLICDVISSMMNSSGNSEAARGVMFESIILDLLEGKIRNEKELSGRLRANEWTTGQKMYAVTIDISKYNDPSFIDFFKYLLCSLIHNSRSVFYNDTIVMIIDTDLNTEESKCFTVLEGFLKRNDFHAGISRKFECVINLPKFYQQSRKALYLGKISVASGRTFWYEDYDVTDFIFKSSKHLDILNFCHPGVLQLKEYDADNNTDYYKTLYEYLKNDKNVILTAGSLYIHRNTVNFRLSKIEELMGLSLRNCKDTLHIFLTYKILETDILKKGQHQ